MVYNKDKDKDKTIDDESLDIDDLIAQEELVHLRALMRYKLPQDLSLKNSLVERTKAELDDICHSLGIKGYSKLRKAPLIDKMYPEMLNFMSEWIPSLLKDQYEGLVDKAPNGIVTAWDSDEPGLEYLRGIGMLSCGSQANKLVWYIPTEIQAELKKADSPTYRKRLAFNSKVATLVTGCLFYYGYLDFDDLYEKVTSYLTAAEQEHLSLYEFVAIMLNANGWVDEIDILEDYGVKYYLVVDADKIVNEQLQRNTIDYAKFSYDEIYAAGQIIRQRNRKCLVDTPAWRKLAKYFAEKCQLNRFEARDVLIELYILLQNFDGPNDMYAYLMEIDKIHEQANADELLAMLMEINNTTRLWILKGHTPDELSATLGLGKIIPFNKVVRKKVGRNAPCPCGSGKKYKNCCLHKDEN